MKQIDDLEAEKAAADKARAELAAGRIQEVLARERRDGARAVLRSMIRPHVDTVAKRVESPEIDDTEAPFMINDRERRTA